MHFSPEYVTFCRGARVPRQPLRQGDWYWVQGPNEEQGKHIYGGWTPEGHIRLWQEPPARRTPRLARDLPADGSKRGYDGSFEYGTADWNDRNWKELDGPPIWLPLEGDWIELLRDIRIAQDPFTVSGPYALPIAYSSVFDWISRHVAREAMEGESQPDVPLMMGRLWRQMTEGGR